MDSSEVASSLYLSQFKSLLTFGNRLYSIITVAVFALVLIIFGKYLEKKQIFGIGK